MLFVKLYPNKYETLVNAELRVINSPCDGTEALLLALPPCPQRWGAARQCRGWARWSRSCPGSWAGEGGRRGPGQPAA